MRRHWPTVMNASIARRPWLARKRYPNVPDTAITYCGAECQKAYWSLKLNPEVLRFLWFKSIKLIEPRLATFRSAPSVNPCLASQNHRMLSSLQDGQNIGSMTQRRIHLTQLVNVNVSSAPVTFQNQEEDLVCRVWKNLYFSEAQCNEDHVEEVGWRLKSRCFGSTNKWRRN